MRELAKIVTIKELLPIDGKDRIELATFKENTYRVIVQKGFSVGDLAVFVETDSMLPNDAKYEFLKARCFKEYYQRYLIKPMKMAGHISMGIVFDLSFLPKRKKPYKAGEDVTEVMDIKKYEPIEDASPKKKTGLSGFMWEHALTRPIMKVLSAFSNKESKAFPTWYISKSDETNLQDCSFILDKYKDTLCYVTIKMEGQSATYLWQPKRNCLGIKKNLGRFTVCSRNNAYFVKRGMPHLFDLAERLNVKKALEDYYKKHGVLLAVQGEVVGPKIQKNIYSLPCHHFFVYTIKDITHDKLLGYNELCAAFRELSEGNECWQLVPCCGSNIVLSTLQLNDNTLAEGLCHKAFKKPFLEEGNQKVRFIGQKNKDWFLHEGVVVRGMNNEFSFKIKDAEYAYDFSGKE